MPSGSTTRLVRLDTGDDVFVVTPREEERAALEASEVPDGPRLLASYADEELTRAYGQWCGRKGQPGDCLRLLDEGPLLASDGKYTLALAIAMDAVWDETAEALEDMADPRALLATITASVTMYLLLWTLPEPVSKGLAATLTAVAIAYLGVDTVLRLIEGGWRWCAGRMRRPPSSSSVRPGRRSARCWGRTRRGSS